MSEALFQIENKSGKAHIKIIGSIGGWRNNSREFTQKVDTLIAAGVEELDLYINCYGGVMSEANEIINQLLRFTGKRSITIGAIAASAAFTIVAEFTKELTYCHSNTLCMYHDPAGYIRVEKIADFDSNKALFEKSRKSVVKSLAARMNMSKEKVSDNMSKTTWLDADELVSLGIVGKANVINKKEPAPKGARNSLENMGFDIPTFFNALEEPLPEFIQPTNHDTDMELKEFAKMIGLPENATKDQVEVKAKLLLSQSAYAQSALLNEGKEKGFNEEKLKPAIEQNFEGTRELVNSIEVQQPPATPTNEGGGSPGNEGGGGNPAGTRPSDILQELKKDIEKLNNGGGGSNEKKKLTDYTEDELDKLEKKEPKKFEQLFQEHYGNIDNPQD